MIFLFNLSTRLVATILVCFIVFATVFVGSATVYADVSTSTSANSVADNVDEYNKYKDEISSLPLATKAIKITKDNIVSNTADVRIENDVIVWDSGKGELTFEFDVSDAARYNLNIVWKPKTSGMNLLMGVKVDGEFPFSGFSDIELRREWKNASEGPRVDSNGDEYAQEQIETGEFITTYLCDKEGVITERYELGLNTGVHTIILCSPEQGLEISQLELSPIEKTTEYTHPEGKIETDADIIVIEAEDSNIKNANSIIPKSNNSDAGMSPNDLYNIKINYIGGTSWQLPGDKLSWNFDVEVSGYYSIGMRYKQADLVNGESVRMLRIDGEVPFLEAGNLKFPYGTKWKYSVLGEGEPYYIWLEKGKHTISLEVTLGEQAQYFSRLSKIVDILGDEYIKIVKITGENPDLNRDYELFNQIPDFTKTLTYCKDELSVLTEDMKKASSENSTQTIASIENMTRVLKQMLKNSYSAQQYVSDYYSNYTSLCSLIYDMKKLPLALDKIQIVPAGTENVYKEANFFKKVWFGILRLVLSFTADYSTATTGKNDPNAIKLWVSWSQEQTAILESLIKDSFTPKTGINVELQIVNASLINGILSGNFPDVSLQMARATPVNLGIRGAVADLTQFPDYKEVLKRFHDGAEMPYTYNGKLYALPDTENFFVMFYRSDILESLNIEPPKTWEEFLHASVILQRNNMNVYVPYGQITTATTVDAGIGSLHLYPTLMMQNNLSIYNDKLTATDLLNDDAVGIFKFWTDMYNDYMYLKEADFYNRFRVGVMPLGIAAYSNYMTFYSAAPEIQGRWSIAMIPGTVGEDGKINHSVAGSGTGCTITELSTKKTQAWEFLKWWVSAETQIRFSNNMESILGLLGRITPANKAALEGLAWDKEHLDVLVEQRDSIVEVPEVPGSYYVTRSVDQAFWAVVNGEKTEKDALTKWAHTADAEMKRKISEFIVQ